MSWHDLLFTTLPGLFPRLTAPASLGPLLSSKRSPAAGLWMMRSGVGEGVLRKGAWNLLILTSAAALTGFVLSVLLGGALYAVVPCLVVPLIAASLYMNSPESFATAEERRMLREAPSVMGSLTMSMQVTPSLEEAVAFASEREDGVLARRLREARWFNITRSRSSLDEALEEVASSLSDSNHALRQAIHLAVASTCERTKEGMDRLLDKANSAVLTGVRDAVDSYVASLTLPTMVLFSLGTLLPIMMFSVLPLLSVGTSIGGATGSVLPFPYLVLLLLAVIPASALAYSWKILSRNPLGLVKGTDQARKLLDPRFLGAWSMAVVAAALLGDGDVAPYLLSGAAVLPPCVYFGWKLKAHGGSARQKRMMEREASAALFQIGNRMLSGATFENALSEASLRGGGRFSELVKTLLYRSRLSGAGLDAIIVEDGTLGDASLDLESAYVTVARCAERDPVYAGQVALNLAQMLSDLRACQGKVEERLRGVVEMMTSTGTIFAPIVLGVTGSLFTLISAASASDGSMSSGIILLSGLYIGELSFLMAFFTVLLMGERSWTGVARSYAMRTPIAFAIFTLVSIICRTGLSALL